MREKTPPLSDKQILKLAKELKRERGCPFCYEGKPDVCDECYAADGGATFILTHYSTKMVARALRQFFPQP